MLLPPVSITVDTSFEGTKLWDCPISTSEIRYRPLTGITTGYNDPVRRQGCSEAEDPHAGTESHGTQTDTFTGVCFD